MGRYTKKIKMKKGTYTIGREGEERALQYLESHGMKIVERNFRNRQGEIDIIGYDRGCLVFVEVKYRTNEKTGAPESAVTWQKQRKICRLADYYRYLHHYGEDKPFRYDVVALDKKRITWYQNAFEHISR